MILLEHSVFCNYLVLGTVFIFFVTDICNCYFLNKKKWVQIFSRGREGGVRFTSKDW